MFDETLGLIRLIMYNDASLALSEHLSRTVNKPKQNLNSNEA